MSLLQYNGLSVHLLRTLEFHMSNDRDPSGTDVLWQTYTVRCQGIVINDGGSLVTPSKETLAQVKHILQTPRRNLLYSVNGTTMLSTVGIDAAMGPEPLPSIVRQMTSDAIFVEVGYRVRMRDCAGGPSDPVVSLRWSQSESYDDNWFVRFSTSGRLIVRSDLRKTADSFRNLATPAVDDHHVRISSKYTLSHSGTELDFEFVDAEKYMMPPRPATKASGHMTVSVIAGARRTGECHVHLEGPPNVKRGDLMAVAIRVAFSKMQSEGMMTSLLMGRFTEQLFDNVVDVTLSGLLTSLATPANTARAGLGLGLGLAAAVAPGVGLAAFAGRELGLAAGEFVAGGVGGGAAKAAAAVGANQTTPNVFATAGVTPGYSEPLGGLAPPVRRRLTALLAASFRDPCAAAAVELQGEPGPSSADLRSSPGRSTAELRGGSFSLGTGVLPIASGVASIRDSAPYDHYLCQAEYYFDSGRRQLPGTGVGAAAKRSALVSVHGGNMRMEASWTAQRTGIPPVLPKFDSNNPNLVPLDAVIIPEGVSLGADGVSPIYCTSGKYVYAVLDSDQATVMAPIPPFLSDPLAAAALLTAGYYSDSVLGVDDTEQGQNPFAGRTNASTPDANLAVQLGAAASGDSGGSSADQGLAAMGGLESIGGSGGLLGGSTVNA